MKSVTIIILLKAKINRNQMKVADTLQQIHEFSGVVLIFFTDIQIVIKKTEKNPGHLTFSSTMYV